MGWDPSLPTLPSRSMNDMELQSMNAIQHRWPEEGLIRVPNWVYQEREVYAAEQARIFQGPAWHYLALEAELPDAGDFKTTFVGDASVVVTRDRDGEIHAFENRCAHRGSLICLKNRGNAKDFTCVYHAWNYDLQGTLRGVAFRRGVKGKGGMPATFRMEDHGPRKLKVARFSELVFGTFAADAPEIESYLGPEIATRIRRVLAKPVTVLGSYTQALPNNWKLYVENVKDSYHASLLHVFFTTFEINRLSQSGGIIVDESGGNHVSYSKLDTKAGTEYDDLRSKLEDFRLADPSLLESVDEFGDGVTLQILSVFPSFVLQQVQNCLAVRQVVPKSTTATDLVWTYLGFADDDNRMRTLRLKQANLVGPAGYISMEDGAVGGFVQRGIAGAPHGRAVVEMGGHGAESQDTRATETSVRGFWKAYRQLMEL
jgi:anthranilate 1,2-dioxygenase large subunit